VTPTTAREDDEPIGIHYVMVIVVEVVTLTALWLLSRWFR
jgi:hypothetical protein